jgi:formylglycine-generating enzyme required for sulfatase activity
MGNPYEPGGNTMVLRGGAWHDDAREDARVSFRVVNHPDYFGVSIGLRVVVAPVL